MELKKTGFYSATQNVASRLKKHKLNKPRWASVKPMLSIAIHNFNYNLRQLRLVKNSGDGIPPVYLNFNLGDVLLIVEQFGAWSRGYLESDANKSLGIFPSNYVQVFNDELNKPLDMPNSSYLSSYFYILLDPLFLQVVRTLREWQQYLFQFYRNNNDSDRFEKVSQLSRELISLCSILSKDLAPALWKKRSNRLLKLNTSNTSKDPFGFLDEEEHANEELSPSGDAIDASTLEELYEKILRRLNKGNYLLDIDIMPSFTHSTFNLKPLNLHSKLFDKSNFHATSYRIRKTGKFRPYNPSVSSRYLTQVLQYYSRLKRNYKHLNNKYNNGESLYDQCPSSPQAFLAEKAKKCRRRHLILTVRDFNFSSLFNVPSSDSDNLPVLQIDAYVLRTKGNNQPNSTENSQSFEIVTEKYCYRIRANGQLVAKSLGGAGNLNRAMFVDILSKQSAIIGSNLNRLSSTNLSSLQNDSANYYLVIQVWRYGKMHVENKSKNMLSTGASLATGASVFHTMSSTSLSSASSSSMTAPSSASISSITSFASGSSLFYDKQTSGSDSASIDSSEFGASSFKRSVGFSVISFQDLVSRDQELKSFMGRESMNEDFISRLLLNDETLPINIKLYEGDLTASNLETILKWAHSNQTTLTSATNPLVLPNSLSTVCKLPLLNNVQMVICAKYISEYIEPNTVQNQHTITSDSSGDSLNLNNSITDSLISSSQNFGLFALIRRKSFGDMVLAGQFRNDLYLTIDWAEFEKGGKAIGKNIEVSVCLITENGIQERAISSGANDEQVTIYRSHIQYHQNSPKWFEHIKINVPLELFENAHLRFTFAHCSSKERERKMIGFSFLPLSDKNGVTVSDGRHELYIYKCDNERKFDESPFYLGQAPYSPNDVSNSKSLSTSSPNISGSTMSISSSSLLNNRSPKEIFYVKTNLVSSKLTQNADILSLLKYNSTPSRQVYDALKRIGRISGEEMVKFLEDILDALFALFTTGMSDLDTSTDSSQVNIIFKVLVDFLKTLNEQKFVSYLSALETYISQQFSAPLVHSDLMVCVRRYIQLVINYFQSDNSMSGGKKRELEFCLRCLSVLDWILKIIVQSRLLYNKAASTGSIFQDSNKKAIVKQTNESFKADLLLLFNSIDHLLSVESKSSDDYLIIAIQESVLSALPNSFGYLSKILSPIELTKLIQSIVQFDNRLSMDWTPSTPTNSLSSIRRTITDAKLSLLQASIRCKYIWLNDEARLELLYTFIRLFNVYITESKCCLKILEDVIVYLIENSHATKDARLIQQCEKEIEMLSIGVIDSISESIIKLIGIVSNTFELLPNKSEFVVEEDYLGKLITCFILLLDFLTLKNYEKLFETREASLCKALMNNIFVVFLNALYYFSDNWLEIKMELNRIILKSLILLKVIMSKKFLGSPQRFDLDIWKTYFKLAIAFLTQSRLQLDSQPFWRQKLVLDVYGGDLRIIMAEELIDSWLLVESNKTLFVPSMVSSFVDAILVPQIEVRKLIIPIFYDMLAIDYQINSNFYQVESQLISRLDNLAYKPECDCYFKGLFTQILLNQIENKKPIWYLDGVQSVKSISRLLSLLIDYRNELKFKLRGISEVDDRLLMCTYSLLRFYREEIKSPDCQAIMLRYIEKLSSLNLALCNYSEAAFTFQLQAELLTWSPDNAIKKEQLYEKMLNFFEKGKSWEEGLKVCKELEEVYLTNFKYKKLSDILRRRAQLLDNILNVKRPENEYFRVSFYGLDFPSFLQNTTFIFRGFEFEKLPSFTQRIQLQFPNAQLLTKIPSDEDITKSRSQYIQIFAVKPIAEPPALTDNAFIFGQPDDIFSFYNTNFVRKFIQDRPIQRGAFDKNNEFKSLWIERAIFTIERRLPGLLKMFEVKKSGTIFLSPIENACETIEKMNNELSKLILNYTNSASPPESISPLSMRLQGILEAAVNGGISKYIEAFLSTEFLTSNPDQIANVTRLKNRISKQCKAVESGLMLHGQLAPPPVRPLHSRLLERFTTMRTMIQQANNETAQAMLWTSSSQSTSLMRPSILSQPLPPIPTKQQHEFSTSDLETSSQSSSSSSNFQVPSNSFDLNSAPSVKSRISPPIISSPSSNSMKTKAFSVLPAIDEPRMSNETSITSSKVQGMHVCQSLENGQFKTNAPSSDECIYSIPQLPESILNAIVYNESSVDDSLDYYIDSHTLHSHKNDALNRLDDSKRLRNIHRSRSITSQTLLSKQFNLNTTHTTWTTNGGNKNTDQSNTLESYAAPPPLPPRASNLDRSNSLNSDVRSFPTIPPALPQKPARKSSTCLMSIPLNINSEQKSSHLLHSSPDNFISGVENEFGNLVISSPTPRSDTNQSNRPAPIIGIELNTDSESPLVSLINSQNNRIQECRTKSSSLPRMQQFILDSTSKTNGDR